jgi:hypothetical protein
VYFKKMNGSLARVSSSKYKAVINANSLKIKYDFDDRPCYLTDSESYVETPRIIDSEECENVGVFVCMFLSVDSLETREAFFDQKPS